MPQQTLTDIFFESFDLHPSVLSGLHAAGFTRCTPIQALTLPLALIGRDVAGQAQTGTGKTAAFLVATLNRLLTRPALPERTATDPRALIIAPTRELAIQIEKDFQAIGRNTGLKSALIYGGVDYDKQRDQLRGGVDIIIATPGRLLDYFKQHVFSFRAVEVMVIDEADRMFDLGFIKDVRFVMRRLPERDRRQCMLFSATLSHRVLELAYEHMNEAEKLTVETENITADRVRQTIYFPASEEKIPLLVSLLSRIDATRSMIFVNMKVAAEKVARRLERQGFLVGMLSGDVPQKKRQTLLGKFQRGEIEVLIATDVAARGLHIADVSHVINYDLPQDAEDYVHRIGRTARLGADGDAISFACDLYAQSLPEIEAYIGQKIPVATIDPAMLVLPPPRHRPASFVSSIDQDDEEETTLAAAVSGPGGSRRPPPRQRHGSSGPRREGSSREGARRPHVAAATAVAPIVAAAGNTPAANESVAKEPRSNDAALNNPGDKRRRRGGRGRRRGERIERGDAPTESAQPAVAAASAAAASKAEARPASKKPGFFHRLGRLFKR
ncbi:MAG TPA: DEAD/DEAH box helicase [Rudaea sp.]|jgi:ATP-dependent RNA helicase RhlB|uniref:DEAD/DEAH box helicase n=1 Tax=Rudaea sp. TaxID=2136325 RepID=UPI002F920D3A